MYNGSHARAKKHSRIRMNKLAILFIAVVMLIGAVAGSTVAFLVTDTQPVTNTFEYAKVSCEVVEDTWNQTTKSGVHIKNTGTTDAYIRATYVVNWLNKEDGTIAASVPTDYSYSLMENPDSKWTYNPNDGYFYYWTPVAPGGFTAGSLLTCIVTKQPDNPQYILSVEILATAVQSTPANAVQEAWGVSPSGN